MTRTRNKFYIISQARKTSDFIKKIVPLYRNELNKNKCPICVGNLVKINGKFGKFIECSNYPACDFKLKNGNANLNWNFGLGNFKGCNDDDLSF